MTRQEQTFPKQKSACNTMSKLSFSSVVLSLATLAICCVQAWPSKAENTSEPNELSATSSPYIAEEQEDKIPYGRFYLNSQPLWEANFKAPVAWLSVNNRLLNVGSLFAKRIASYDTVSGLAIWNTFVSAPITSPPLCFDNMLIAVAKDCSVTCLDMISGEAKYWVLPFPYDQLIKESKKKLYESAQNSSERLTAAQAMAKAKEKAKERQFRNQLLRLKFSTLPRLSYSSPCQGEKKIVCLSGDGIITQFAIDGTNASWHLLECNGISNKPFVSDPAIQTFSNKNSEYLYSISLNGRLWSTDLNNPDISISQQVGSSRLEFRQPLRIIKNFLYATASNGHIFCYALGADSEGTQYFKPKFVWRYIQAKHDDEQTNSQGALINAPSFDLRKPRCFFINDKTIVSLASLSGQLLWRYQSSKHFSAPALYWNGNVLAATENQSLLVLDAESGRLKQEYVLPFTPSCPLVIDDKYLYIGGAQGQIACLKISNTPLDLIKK